MPSLLGCVMLECIIVFSSEIAPRWFPLQPLRFLSTLNLLLAVPIGYVVITVIDALIMMFLKMANFIRSFMHLLPLSQRAVNVLRSAVTSSVLLIIALSAILLIEIPYYAQTFSAGPSERIDPILTYASKCEDCVRQFVAK
jgi:hypothetical protein